MKQRRQRIDTTAGAIAVMAKATQEIQPPSNVPLSKEELPFFASIIDELPRSDWTAHQLETAALLSRAMSQLERDQRSLRSQGSTFENAKGEIKANPLVTICKQSMDTIVSMRRSLALHARATQGEPRDIAKRRDIAKDIESNNPLDDDLLARPH